jgi:two-component system chemotaxis response regulator CheY
MKKCLIVDDSRVIRKVARRIVEDLHFEPDEAEDGMTALEHCRQNMPDAILLDANMPTMSGADFLRALRREPNGMKPVVVLCLTECDVQQVTEAVHAGANEWLLKPFDRDMVKQSFSEAGLV